MIITIISFRFIMHYDCLFFFFLKCFLFFMFSCWKLTSALFWFIKQNNLSFSRMVNLLRISKDLKFHWADIPCILSCNLCSSLWALRDTNQEPQRATQLMFWIPVTKKRDFLKKSLTYSYVIISLFYSQIILDSTFSGVKLKNKLSLNNV